MKKILALGFIFFVCVVGWEVGGRLSTDALGLALGVIFGVMAGVPAALIAISAGRRHEPSFYPSHEERSHPHTMRAYQPPVIIVTGAPQGQTALGSGASNHQGYPAQPYLGYTGGQPQVVDSYARALPDVQAPGGQAARSSQRQFRLVGEREQMIEEW